MFRYHLHRLPVSIARRYLALLGLHALGGVACTQGCALGYHISAFQA
jgi:hypothetical protein